MRFWAVTAQFIFAPLAIIASSSVSAQEAPQADLEQLSRNLEDAETSFQYARAAAAAGDTKAAIAALERVLQINPDLANIKLELGLLYLRVGQADLARSYLEAAVNAPDAPPDARIRARQALRTAEGNLSTLRLAGFLSSGVQYQSNPNGSPDFVSVQPQLGNVSPIILSGDDLTIPRGGDFSFNLSGNLEAAVGLGGQAGHELVLDGYASQNWYRDETDIDLTYLQGRFGPRFNLGGATSSTGLVRPYVLGTLLSLGGDRYYGSVGGGADLLFRTGLTTSVAIEGRYEDRTYRNSTLRGAASDQSGDYWTGQVQGTWQFQPRTRLIGNVNGQIVDADRAYQSRKSGAAQIGLGHVFAPPVGTLAWYLSGSFGYRYTRYEEPDTLVDRDTRRQEDRFDVALALSIPLNASLALDARFQHTWNRANLPNYDYNNVSGLFGVTARF
ncbi:tetratricopeptide repeat protein [Novosphingobium kaempferiae]|uniref:tetratricopeptide repeat protein n=1 Tax=Novosphingobium kaempferiae TaxID=2896849 RepID=UPI001E3178A5|nr:tetratricopeptide repeat protein [Novosphingobium kaempferiae]